MNATSRTGRRTLTDGITVALLVEREVANWTTEIGPVDVLVGIPDRDGLPVVFDALRMRAQTVVAFDHAIAVASLDDIIAVQGVRESPQRCRGASRTAKASRRWPVGGGSSAEPGRQGSRVDLSRGEGIRTPGLSGPPPTPAHFGRLQRPRDNGCASVRPTLAIRQRRGCAMGYKRITINPSQMGGLACIRGLRIPVTTIVGQLAAGRSHEQILVDFPDLEEADIYAALEYAAAAVKNANFRRPQAGETARRPEPRDASCGAASRSRARCRPCA